MPEKDELISTAKAAKFLNTSKSAIGKWASTGAITSVTVQGKPCFYRNEILYIRDIRDRRMSLKHDHDELVMLKYEMIKIRRLFQAISSYLQIPDKLMTFSDEDLNIWYEKAVVVARGPNVFNSKFNFKEWLVVLKNLHETELKRLKHLRGDPVPFVPFIQVCNKVISWVKPFVRRKSRGYIRYVDWVHLFLLARNTLRDRAIIMLSEERPDISPIQRVDLALSLPSPPILESLAAKKKKG